MARLRTSFGRIFGRISAEISDLAQTNKSKNTEANTRLRSLKATV